jgi:(p)ppGpp synthase/HD superfamily hydrolase
MVLLFNSVAIQWCCDTLSKGGVVDNEHPLIKEAYSFAQKKHWGYKRKYTKETYFTHSLGVYFNVYSYTNDVNIRAAALLHDTIEKTSASYDEVSRHFNKEIADLVVEVTNEKHKMEAIGKTEYLTAKMAVISNEALTIKLADRMESIENIKKFDLKDPIQHQFAKDYLSQTIYIFNNLKREFTTEHKLIIKKIGVTIDHILKLLKTITPVEPEEEEQNEDT